MKKVTKLPVEPRTATYAVQPIVALNRPKDDSSANELLDKIEDRMSTFVDWMFKVRYMNRSRTDHFCASLDRYFDDKAKNLGMLASWKAFEASVERDGEENK